MTVLLISLSHKSLIVRQLVGLSVVTNLRFGGLTKRLFLNWNRRLKKQSRMLAKSFGELELKFINVFRLGRKHSQ
jgi:hypothetical protein